MYKRFFIFILSILLLSSVRAQKIENLVELKKNSHNEIFHYLAPALCAPVYEEPDY